MRVLVLLLALASCGLAQSTGPDVIVGDLPGASSYGTLNGESAFSLGTTSCNQGTVPLAWYALPSVDHPVIAQDLYRIKDGRFTQIGMSWLKHGFTALNQNLCATCQPTPGTTLGVGCSDPYSSGLNGSQSNLGPRSDVDAATGTFPAPNPPAFNTLLDRRLRVRNADIDPAQNQGAIYLAEGHYIAADDHAAGHANNNASWRTATFGPDGTGGWTMTLTGQTVREKAAIEGWQFHDPNVQIARIDVPGDGRIIVAYLGEPIPGSNAIRHFFAIENFNSDRGVSGLQLDFPLGANPTQPWHHKIDHHSGEPYSNAAWTFTSTATTALWQNDAPFTADPNANAIRWGTCYSFELISDLAPTAVTLELFKPGTPSTVSVGGLTFPGPPPYQTNQPGAHLDFDGASNAGGQAPIAIEVLPGTLVTANLASNVAGGLFDVALTPTPPVPAVTVTASGQRLNVDPLAYQWLMGGFTLPMPPGGLSLPFPTPTGFNLEFGAQMAVIDAAAPDGFWFSAPVDFHSRPCQPGSQPLTLGDDTTALVPLGPGTPHACVSGVNFGGTTYTSLRVHANGTITFGGLPTGNPPTTVQDFLAGPPRIAALWTDLDPGSGGSVTVGSTQGGALAVTWNGVATAGSSGTASSVTVNFDSAAGSLNISQYAPDPAHALPTLVGIKTAFGLAVGSNVSFGSLSFAGPQTGSAGTALYQMTAGGAPGGFNLILFPFGDESSYLVY